MRLKLINDNVLNVEIPKCRLLLTDIPYDEITRKDSGLRNLDKGKADIETFELTPFLVLFGLSLLFWLVETIQLI